MECNRDEANRAKEIAEKKFVAKDIPGAKKFALKAQNLYPGLQGLPQMLDTLDVYLSAGNTPMGIPDFYAILDANPVADEKTLRKQYRKLALKLHPDKNNAIGADGAFKIVSEAWSVLSNKMKRDEYDRRRFIKTPSTTQHRAEYDQRRSMKTPSTTQPSTNPSHNFTNKPPPSHDQRRFRKTPSTTQPSTNPSHNFTNKLPPSRQANPTSFWTLCHRCKMQFEYLREYLNYNLICPTCHVPFHALETSPPTTTPYPYATVPPTTKSDHQHASNSNSGSAKFPGHVCTSPTQSNFQQGPSNGTTGHESASVSTQAERVVHQAYEKVKRDREEAQAAAERHETIRRSSQQKRAASNLPAQDDNTGSYRPSKKRNVNEGAATAKATSDKTTGEGMMDTKQTIPISTDSVECIVEDKTKPISGVNKLNSEAQAAAGRHETNSRKVAGSNLSAGDANTESYRPSKKRNVDEGGATAKATGDEDKGKDMDTGKQTIPDTDSFVSIKKQVKNKTEPISGVDNPTFEVEMMVPDPDFHDFDKDRLETCFAENQVWAVYDEEDGMPRYYAMIHTVISQSPFKLKISWLDCNTNNEFGTVNWVGSGFSKTCGDFRVDKYVIYNSLNSFSHRVKWAKGPRGAVRILPKKGDVWALYRNWSPNWNELTPDDLIHKYDMVEVVDDYKEQQGVFVVPLVKVVGFKTVFRRHLDPREVKLIPKEEMFRLSHQVPSYLLTDLDAPKGCCELDPAATPLELLQVI